MNKQHSYQWVREEKMWAVVTWCGEVVALLDEEELAKECVIWLNKRLDKLKQP